MLGALTPRRPRGLMTPRGPGVLAILLAVTLGAMLYWGARQPELPSRQELAAPADAERDHARAPDASPPVAPGPVDGRSAEPKH